MAQACAMPLPMVPAPTTPILCKLTGPHLTNGIVNLFTNDELRAKILRKLVLRFTNNFAPIKHTIINRLTEIDVTFPR
jgi:hypothetical protein